MWHHETSVFHCKNRSQIFFFWYYIQLNIALIFSNGVLVIDKLFFSNKYIYNKYIFIQFSYFPPNLNADSISLTASWKFLSLYILFPPTPYWDSQYLKTRTKKKKKIDILSFLKDCNYGNRTQTMGRSAKHFYNRNCKDTSKRRYPSLTENLLKDTWVLYYFFM